MAVDNLGRETDSTLTGSQLINSLLSNDMSYQNQNKDTNTDNSSTDKIIQAFESIGQDIQNEIAKSNKYLTDVVNEARKDKTKNANKESGVNVQAALDKFSNQFSKQQSTFSDLSAKLANMSAVQERSSAVNMETKLMKMQMKVAKHEGGSGIKTDNMMRKMADEGTTKGTLFFFDEKLWKLMQEYLPEISKELGNLATTSLEELQTLMKQPGQLKNAIAKSVGFGVGTKAMISGATSLIGQTPGGGSDIFTQFMDPINSVLKGAPMEIMSKISDQIGQVWAKQMSNILEIKAMTFATQGFIGALSNYETKAIEAGKTVAEETGKGVEDFNASMNMMYRKGFIASKRQLGVFKGQEVAWQEMNSLSKSFLTTSTITGVGVGFMSEMFSEWMNKLNVSNTTLGSMSRSIMDVSRNTGLFGDELEKAITASKELIEILDQAGSLTAESARNVMNLAGFATKFGTDKSLMPLFKAWAAGGGEIWKLPPETQAFISKMTRGNIDMINAMDQGMMKQEHFAMAATNLKKWAADLGVRSMADFRRLQKERPDLARNINVQVRAGGVKGGVGELFKQIQTFEEAGRSIDERINELHKALNEEAAGSAKAKGLMKQIQTLQVTKGSQMLDSLAESIGDMGMTLPEALKDMKMGEAEFKTNMKNLYEGIQEQFAESGIMGGKQGELTARAFKDFGQQVSPADAMSELGKLLDSKNEKDILLGQKIVGRLNEQLAISQKRAEDPMFNAVLEINKWVQFIASDMALLTKDLVKTGVEGAEVVARRLLGTGDESLMKSFLEGTKAAPELIKKISGAGTADAQALMEKMKEKEVEKFKREDLIKFGEQRQVQVQANMQNTGAFAPNNTADAFQASVQSANDAITATQNLQQTMARDFSSQSKNQGAEITSAPISPEAIAELADALTNAGYSAKDVEVSLARMSPEAMADRVYTQTQMNEDAGAGAGATHLLPNLNNMEGLNEEQLAVLQSISVGINRLISLWQSPINNVTPPTGPGNNVAHKGLRPVRVSPDYAMWEHAEAQNNSNKFGLKIWS